MAVINWFPGHMAKAKREIAKKIPQIDLIIELLDARIPFSSENPLVNTLREQTPCLKLLNKSDLADQENLKLWLSYYNAQPETKAIALTKKTPKAALALLPQIKQQFPDKEEIHVMILGIPNVGKSTLINTLAKRTIAKTGNEPAVTQRQQRINLENNIILWDTPGFLWPKLEPEACAYRLAITGAIKANIIDYSDVAYFLVDFLQKHYPEELCKRYNISLDSDDPVVTMEAIGAKRACWSTGKQVNYHKVSEILLNEYRQGALGNLSLETPAMIEQERAAYAIVLAEKAAKKKAREEKKKKKKRN
jgi:ribosome biogenesis GTPase A